ncbi:hypothetical protein GCM10022240_26760 [Microbacterium kribbense]|uniref:Uncharacterized protein n=1 Tax=Microbacterium kribbense TaxID=433645 RepID=A0ABP7GSH1_9MICO
MTRTRIGPRPPIVRSLGLALVLITASILLIAALAVAEAIATAEATVWMIVLAVIGGLVYAGAGLIAWSRRPSNTLGPIMLLGAVVWLVGALGANGPSPVALTAVVIGSVPLAVVVHLLLAFPSGRLRSPAAHGVVAAGYAVSLILQIPLYLWNPDASPGGVLAIADRPGPATVGAWVQAAAGISVMICTAGILISRLRRAPRERRRVLTPLYGYGIAAVLLVPLAPWLLGPIAPIGGQISFVVQSILLAGAPLLFTLTILLGGFAQTGELEELGTWLGRAAGQRPQLAAALAHALGDDTVQLAYWMPGRGGYVDAEGQLLPEPASDESRGAVEIEVDGRLVGGVRYDRTLIADPVRGTGDRHRRRPAAADGAAARQPARAAAVACAHRRGRRSRAAAGRAEPA